MSKGYVYALSNPFMPGILKIGRSIAGGQGRADTLYKNDTAVPAPFKLEFEMMFDDCIGAEKFFHEVFRSVRVNRNREFFQIGLTAVKLEMLAYEARLLNHGIYDNQISRLVDEDCEKYMTVAISLPISDYPYCMDRGVFQEAVLSCVLNRNNEIRENYKYWETESANGRERVALKNSGDDDGYSLLLAKHSKEEAELREYVISRIRTEDLAHAEKESRHFVEKFIREALKTKPADSDEKAAG